MLQKTFSFWRRMVGTAPVPVRDAGAICDDRRLWFRYATELVGKLHMPDRREGDKVLALVRDLSAAGANLLTDRELQPGQMVTLELPSQDGEIHSVLACVVRTTKQDDGGWSLGCIFSRELSSDDLVAFGARKIPAAANDPRTWVRFPIKFKACCRKVGDAMDVNRPAQVLNISASGIGLSVPDKMDAGTLLNIDLLDKNERVLRTILACIVHTTERTSGEHALGCNFIRELTEDELHSLL